MSVNPRKFRRNIRKIAEIKGIKEKIEIESDLTYLEFMKFDLLLAKKHAKLQKLIHKKQSWRNYVC